MKNRFFVIGSNSFSGATFIDFALAKGARIIGLSRSSELLDVFLPYKWNDHKNFTFYSFFTLVQYLNLIRHLDQV